MKRLLSLTMIAAMVAFAIVACKDDFNEEEFLRLQSELKLKQDEVMRQRNDSTSKESVQSYINAANEAGDLLSVSIIVRENGNALSGVTVSLSSGTTNELSSGRTKAVTTGITDATGNVVFDRVTIGSGTATFSKTGYVTATATYDFASLALAPIPVQIPNPNGNGTLTYFIAPQKRFEEASVPMISATASEGSTATITGKVTIENDLTNLTPEVPAGIVLRANLTSLLGANQGFFTSYVLADNSTLGRATIAADGTYSMVVPATAAGSTINFIVPNLEGTCRIAVNGYDNGTGMIVPLTTPEYRNVPTGWGPSTVFTNFVPTVGGARVVVPNAPAAGTGLSFSLSAVPAPMTPGTISSTTVGNIHGAGTYRISNRGSFTPPIATPTVTITGGGGATASAKLQLVMTNITVSNRGDGYPANIFLRLYATRQAGADVLLSTTPFIPIPDGKLPAAFDLDQIDAISGGFGPDEPPIELDPTIVYTGFYLEIGGAAPANPGSIAPVTVVDLKNVSIDLGGTAINSKPTFTFGSGNAAIDVLEFKTFWDITPVMGPGNDYAVLPDFTVHIPQSITQNGMTTTVDVVNPNGIIEVPNQSLQSQLTISAGDVIKRFASMSIRTHEASTSQPMITIHEQAVAPRNAHFVFDQLNQIDNITGRISLTPTIINPGNGYNSKLTGQIVPTIAGAPGSGATIEFNYVSANYSSTTLEWQYTTSGPNASSMTITNPGTGYLNNLNQQDPDNPNLPPQLTGVQPGKTYTVNFNYGSGQRRVSIN